jgi:hypothetical protein
MPDLSFHEDSGAHPVSQNQCTDTSLPQPGVQVPDAGPVEQASKPEVLSPRHRLLLSLVRPEEQRYFAESSDAGNAEALSVLGRILSRERAYRKRRSTRMSCCAPLARPNPQRPPTNCCAPRSRSKNMVLSPPLPLQRLWKPCDARVKRMTTINP